MKRFVLGTAGHIDHGKTLLTKALTGVDTDRLAEEKARGITIELGFAPLHLSDGTEVSLVDVPGHEKFVRTMMSGVSGVDGILLVVAADDGVMPQTQEHFDILRLLDLQRGIVVLTKTDLADEAQVESVRTQICNLVQGSFLEQAPVCPVSAVTGEGMDALRREIERMVESAGERNEKRPFRMPIDRTFPVGGFGTVATGTLTEGTVRLGDAVQIYPSPETGTIRSLQTHGKNEQEIRAGMRGAMSFSGLSKDAAERGCVAAEPDSLAVTDMLTARIEILADCPYIIRNASQLHLFHGTEEVVCKLRLLDADALRAGQSGFAQLKLARPIPVRWEDRFLLRFFSPVLTVGGGTILSFSDSRLRRNDLKVLERMARLSDEKPAVRLAQRIADAGLRAAEREKLRRLSNFSPEEYGFAEAQLLQSGDVLDFLPGKLVSGSAVTQRREQAESLLSSFHETYPLQAGMRLAEWRSRLFPETDAPAEELLHFWQAQGSIKTENGFVALADFTPVFTQEHKIMQRKLLHYYREAWFFTPDLQTVKAKFERFGTLFEQVLANMRISGMLIPLTPRFWVHHEAYQDALRIFSELGVGGKPVTLAEFRTAADISRKYSQLFLEYWDRHGVTRRVGDSHVLVKQDNKKEYGF